MVIVKLLVIGLFLFMFIVYVCLIYVFVNDDFSVVYVV